MNRKSFQTIITSLLILLMVSGCSPTPEKITQPAATSTTPSSANIVSTPKAVTLPLSTPGPYQMGKREYRYVDASREGRKVNITIWYPALLPAGSTASTPNLDAKPDLDAAPYPLILSSTKIAKIFAPYLVSHGFVWASVNGINTYGQLNEETIDQPLDILFTLNKVASIPPKDWRA